MIVGTHDKCTSHCGEQQSKRWSFEFNSPFYEKGRGKSKMLSYFQFQHKYCSLFELCDDEWKEATTIYPELEERGCCFDCDDRSANALNGKKMGSLKGLNFSMRKVLARVYSILVLKLN